MFPSVMEEERDPRIFTFESELKMAEFLGDAPPEFNAHMADPPEPDEDSDEESDDESDVQFDEELDDEDHTKPLFRTGFNKFARPPLPPPEPLKVRRVRIDDRGLWKPYTGMSLPDLGLVRIPLKGRAKLVPRSVDPKKRSVSPEEPKSKRLTGLEASKYAMPEGTYWTPPLWKKPDGPTYRTYNCRPVCQRSRFVSDEDRDPLDVEADERERRATRLEFLKHERARSVPGSWPDDYDKMEGMNDIEYTAPKKIARGFRKISRHGPSTIVDDGAKKNDQNDQNDQIALMSGALQTTPRTSEHGAVIPLPSVRNSAGNSEKQELVAVDNGEYTTFFYNNDWLSCARRIKISLPGRRRVGTVAMEFVQGAVELSDTFKRRAISLFEKSHTAEERNRTKNGSPRRTSKGQTARDRLRQRRRSWNSSRPTTPERHSSSSSSYSSPPSGYRYSTSTYETPESPEVEMSDSAEETEDTPGYFPSLSHISTTGSTSNAGVPASPEVEMFGMSEPIAEITEEFSSPLSSPLSSPHTHSSALNKSSSAKSSSLLTFGQAVGQAMINRPISAIAKSLTLGTVYKLGRAISRIARRSAAKPSGITKPIRRRPSSRLARKELKEKLERFPDKFVVPWLRDPKPSTPLVQPPAPIQPSHVPSPLSNNQDITQCQSATRPRLKMAAETCVRPELILLPEIGDDEKGPEDYPLPDSDEDEELDAEFLQRPEYIPLPERLVEPEPTSVHRTSWLHSNVPFGKPVSAVRIFNPEAVIPEINREESVYAPVWRDVEEPEQRRPPIRIRPEGPAVRPLSAKWKDVLAISMAKRDDEPLATTLRGAKLTKMDLMTCYKPMAWLNDEIINGYLELIVAYLRRISGNTGRNQKPRYHAFSTFFFSNLRQKGYAGVAKWATRAKIGGEGLLNVDTVFIPVHNSAHWTLMVVKPSIRTIEHFDSLGSLSPAYVALAKGWLRGELGQLYVDEEWSVLPSISPQQDNGSDCGVFLLSTAKSVAVGLEPLSYGATDISLLRQKIVAELMHGGLEGEFDPAGESGELRL